MWPPPVPLMVLAAAAIGAAAFRLRGDTLWSRITGRGIGTARIMWGAVMALVAVAAGHAAVDVVALGVLLYAGATPPWWKSLTLGGNEADGPALGQYLRHAARGLLWTAPAGLYLAASAAVFPALFGGGEAAWHAALTSSGWWLIGAGAMCVPAFQLGKWISPPAKGRSPGSTEWGEMIFGALIGAAIVLAAP